MTNRFYNILGIDAGKNDLKIVSKKLGIATPVMNYYNRNNILPSTEHLQKINDILGVSKYEVMLGMGIFDNHLITQLSSHSKDIIKNFKEPIPSVTHKDFKLVFETGKGKLYKGDCNSLLKSLPDESFDLIFADPPFNLDKDYASEMDDNLAQNDYILWCESWLDECVRTLKTGGSLFVWNLPKWNTYLSKFLNDRLTFKHWIATDIKLSLPIPGRLYPSHYSLLYYTKGEKPNYFNADRLAMDVCKGCYKEIKDYGGYKDKMNPKGVNITDVWFDIPPVRHSKYKKRKEANELSIRLVDRIIEMSSKEGDSIFDPFGGSGTTYIVSEIKGRRWTGIELGPTDGIIERFNNINEEVDYLKKIRSDYNKLFTEKVKSERKKRGLWTEETFINAPEVLLTEQKVNGTKA